MSSLVICCKAASSRSLRASSPDCSAISGSLHGRSHSQTVVGGKHPDVVFSKVHTEAKEVLPPRTSAPPIPAVMVFRERILHASALPPRQWMTGDPGQKTRPGGSADDRRTGKHTEVAPSCLIASPGPPEGSVRHPRPSETPAGLPILQTRAVKFSSLRSDVSRSPLLTSSPADHPCDSAHKRRRCCDHYPPVGH